MPGSPCILNLYHGTSEQTGLRPGRTVRRGFDGRTSVPVAHFRSNATPEPPRRKGPGTSLFQEACLEKTRRMVCPGRKDICSDCRRPEEKMGVGKPRPLFIPSWNTTPSKNRYGSTGLKRRSACLSNHPAKQICLAFFGASD